MAGIWRARIVRKTSASALPGALALALAALGDARATRTVGAGALLRWRVGARSAGWGTS